MVVALNIHGRERQRMPDHSAEVALHQILVAVALDGLGQRESVCSLVRRVHAPPQLLYRTGQRFRFYLAADRKLALSSSCRRAVVIRTQLLSDHLFAHRYSEQ